MVNPVGGQSPAPMSAPVAAPTPSPAAAAPTPSPAAPTPSPTAAAPTPTAPPDVTGGVDSKTQFQVTQNLAAAPSPAPATGGPTPTPSEDGQTPTVMQQVTPAKLELGTKGSGDVINGVRGANGWDQNYDDGISYGDLKTVDVSKITDPDTKAAVQKAQQFAAAQSQPDNTRIDIKTLNDWQGVGSVPPNDHPDALGHLMPF